MALIGLRTDNALAEFTANFTRRRDDQIAPLQDMDETRATMMVADPAYMYELPGCRRNSIEAARANMDPLGRGCRDSASRAGRGGSAF